MVCVFQTLKDMIHVLVYSSFRTILSNGANSIYPHMQ
jgi:hypothetical protein